MKTLIAFILTMLTVTSFAADTTIANLPPKTTIPDSYRMPWEDPGVVDYYITFQNLTNQILFGMASTNWVYSNFMTNGSVSGGGAPLNGTNTWTGTNTFTVPPIGSASGLTNLPIASVTTPGVIVTQGFSSAMTFSNSINVTGNITTLTGTNYCAKFGMGGGVPSASIPFQVTGAGAFTGTIYGNDSIKTKNTYILGPSGAINFSEITNIVYSGGSYFGAPVDGNYGAIGCIVGSPSTMLIRNATNGIANLVVYGSGTFTNGLTSYGDVSISGASSDLSVDGYTTNKLGVVVGTPDASAPIYHWISQTNSTLGYTNVMQPLNNFAFLSMETTNLINGGANTYAPITNYTTARSNVMGCNLVGGVITNINSGFYKVGIHLSGVAVDNSATVEGDLLLNGVEKDEVSFITQFDNPPRTKGMTAIGILYITNNTPVTFQIKSSGAGGVNVWRAQVTVSTP